MLAIARREELGVAVTDVLVERGDHDVIRAVAANDGARLSRSGFHRLIDRSKGDAELQETIGTRPDLPDDCYPALLAQATETVIRKLSATRAFHDASRVRRVTHDAADRFAAILLNGDSDLAAAMAELQALRDRGQLDERLLRDFARRRQMAYVLAGLSLICDLGLAITRRLFMLDTLDPLVVVAKANGISWLTLRDILRASDERSSQRGGADPGLRQLHQDVAGNRPPHHPVLAGARPGDAAADHRGVEPRVGLPRGVREPRRSRPRREAARGREPIVHLQRRR